jgi:hypothetical protein
LDLKCRRQALNGGRVEGEGRRRRRQRLGLQADGVKGDDRYQRQQQDRREKPDPPGGLQKSTLS